MLSKTVMGSWISPNHSCVLSSFILPHTTTMLPCHKPKDHMESVDCGMRLCFKTNPSSLEANCYGYFVIVTEKLTDVVQSPFSCGSPALFLHLLQHTVLRLSGFPSLEACLGYTSTHNEIFTVTCKSGLLSSVTWSSVPCPCSFTQLQPNRHPWDSF